MAAPQDFTLKETTRDDRRVFELAGELDLASAPILQAALASVAMDGAHAITLDLSGLKFIDSTGLQAILAFRESCRANRRELSLVPGPRPVQRVFEITKLLDVLPFTHPNGRLDGQAAGGSVDGQAPAGWSVDGHEPVGGSVDGHAAAAGVQPAREEV